MARIKQLSKNLINQIAAGEVIERPMSVVKELVENSIDSGANKISIEISNECRDIRVADNGCGIHPDDISLAFTKHATSKIESSEDLYSIKTLGFRGEALASIISISRVTCTTKTKDSDTGFKVICEDSNVKQYETGCAVGTIMNIRDLFYNIPARLKFLKSSKTEFSYIQELVQSIALINTKISFELKNNDKIVLKTDGLGNSLNTIKDIFSKDVTANLKEVLKTDALSGLKLSGYVSTPDYTRSSKKYNIYINSRTVKCPVFQKAIDNAYKTLIAKGKYPFVVLNLELPPEDVDVNVHPTKKEVRYKNTNQIFSFIYSGIDMALSNYTENHVTERINVINFNNNQFTKQEKSDDVYVSDLKEIIQPIPNIVIEPKKRFIEENETKFNSVPKINNNQQKFISYQDIEKDKESEEKIIGQYAKTYILVEKEDGLEIVDQHIAEERYIYEKLKTQKEIASQILFISDIIEVSPTEAEIIRLNRDKFLRYGFEIEVLSDKEVTFKKVPQLLSRVNTKDILSDILENLDGNLSGLEERILITTSCKSAVKAGQELSLYQMQEIIKKWRTCEKPYTCPHGRPISKFFPHKQIAGFFDRNK